MYGLIHEFISNVLLTLEFFLSLTQPQKLVVRTKVRIVKAFIIFMLALAIVDVGSQHYPKG